MKTAIMQPYFFPYIGYYQLMDLADQFVVYDNIEFTKSGWFNRNNILVNGSIKKITLPIKKDSDFLNVDQRYLATNAHKERIKIVRLIENAYRKAPHFNEFFPILKDIIMYNESNLFRYLLNSILKIRKYIGITSDIVISSDIDIDHTNLKGQEKVIAICNQLNTDTYINPIGGKTMYDRQQFLDNGMELKFIQPLMNSYNQFNNEFIEKLSIIDVLMFNSKKETKEMLNNYELIT